MKEILDLNLTNEKILTNTLTNEASLEIQQEVAEGQNNFLNSIAGNAINFGLDIGLKALLPDVVEDIIIDIKDTIFREGFKEGLNTLVNSIKDIGKSMFGMITGNFENLNQIDIATKNGGVIDLTSKLLNIGIDKAIEKEFLDPTLRQYY